MRSVAVLSLAACAALVLVAACERRVEEPPPTNRPALAPSAPRGETAAGGAAGQPAATATDPRLKGRCVRPMPAEPARRAASGVAAGCPPDPEPDRPMLRLGKVHLASAGAVLDVELAEREPDRLRGLMYRHQLSDLQGMLFLFQFRRDHRFWMRNTCIPLDMLFIDSDGLIVGIEENVPTLNDSTYHVGCPSRYVLEVAAGWSRRHGVEPGQFVRFEGL